MMVTRGVAAQSRLRAGLVSASGDGGSDCTDDRDRFLAAMGQAATGVTVVATDGPHGRYAQTVSAMCSVSADPPTVLVCIHRRSPLAEAAVRNGVLSVNVLAADQAHISDTFAGRPATGPPYDFGCATWRRDLTGAPVLVGASATFDCRVRQVLQSGTHAVLFADVEASAVASDPPLVYHARRYGRHQPLGISSPRQESEPA